MKYIQQFAILVIFCFVGEILHKIIPLPIPSAIYGMVLMFCALQFKFMPLSAVETVSDYLLGIMPLLFVPSTVGLIVAWPILQKYGIQFVIIGIVSTMAVFFVTGHVTQLVIRIQKKMSSRLEQSEITSSQLERSGMERSLDCARDDKDSLRDDKTSVRDDKTSSRDDKTSLRDDETSLRDDNDVSDKNNVSEEK